MLSKPDCGWTTFSFRGVSLSASYLEDYPVLLSYALLSASGKLSSSERKRAEDLGDLSKVKIDSEGSWSTFHVSPTTNGGVLAEICEYDGEDDDAKLVSRVLSKTEAQAVMDELANDIEEHFDAWVFEWSLSCDPEYEPDAEALYAERARELSFLVKALRR